jgi:predicted aspartyl protease
MIKGKFINENVPIVKITLSSGKAVQTPYFILDTGFTGDIQVTTKVAEELGLEMIGVTRTGMASGEIITIPTALAFSKMEGKKRVVNVLVSKSMSLVGISFLKKFDYKAIVDCKNKTVALKRVA